MCRVFIILLLFVFTYNVFSNPWTDDDYCYALSKQQDVYIYSKPVIRGKQILSRNDQNNAPAQGIFSDKQSIILIFIGGLVIIKSYLHSRKV